MKRAIGFVIVALILLAPNVAAGSSPDDGDLLPRLLARLDRVASLYKDTALKFSCDEKIVYDRHSRPSLFFEFEYVYEFSDKKGLLDYRVDKRAPHPAGKTPPRAYLSDYGLPYFLTRGYSWIFLFEGAHQSRHKYSLGDQTAVLGRKALAINFEPVPPVEYDVNDWIGTLWVDAETLQPLQVEAIKQVEREKELALQAAVDSTEPLRGEEKTGWAIGRVETEFTQEENGMRFPGKTTITGVHGKVRIRRGKRIAQESALFTVTQTYRNYRFFGVRTLAEIRAIGWSQSDP